MSKTEVSQVCMRRMISGEGSAMRMYLMMDELTLSVLVADTEMIYIYLVNSYNTVTVLCLYKCITLS